MKTQQNICIFRLSALGDVAMLVHAVRNILESNPSAHITIVTRSHLQVLFGSDERLSFHNIEPKGKHKGLLGLHKLFKELKTYNFDLFLDMHDVLRSKIVRSLFKTTKTKIFTIQKNRNDKNDIVNKKTAIKQLKHSVERYLDVAKKSMLKTTDNYLFELPVTLDKKIDTDTIRIGIAPFAAHNSKEWGLEHISELINLLSERKNISILLFGGGKNEEAQLATLSSAHSKVQNIAGKFSLQEELSIMKSCSVFLAMDSGNAHLADLVGIPVVSIWLATHPCLGFYPWRNKTNCVQPSAQELPCRPVSVFGKITNQQQNECVSQARKLITPDLVFEKLKIFIK